MRNNYRQLGNQHAHEDKTENHETRNNSFPQPHVPLKPNLLLHNIVAVLVFKHQAQVHKLLQVPVRHARTCEVRPAHHFSGTNRLPSLNKINIRVKSTSVNLVLSIHSFIYCVSHSVIHACRIKL